MKNPIKILHILESLNVGGAEQLLIQWVEQCQPQFEPIIISFREGILHQKLTDLGAQVYILKKKTAFDITFLFRLFQFIRNSDVDVVNCQNGIPAISYGVTAARIAGIPVICTIHGRTHYLKQNIKTWLWFKIMNLSHLIITVTAGIKEEISRDGGIAQNKIHVIYNGIDTQSDTTRRTDKNIMRKSYGLKNDHFIIGTVGNLRAVKGQKYLIQAMPEIFCRVRNARLVLIGQGQEEQNLKNLARELGIEDKVHLLGYKENAGGMIGMFDVFVLPSLSEGCPMVLLEAMMAQVPIIATRVGGVREIVTDEQEALLVAPSDTGALAQAIVRLADNSALRETLAVNALRRAKEHFDIRTTLAQYDVVYLTIGGIR